MAHHYMRWGKALVKQVLRAYSWLLKEIDILYTPISPKRRRYRQPHLKKMIIGNSNKVGD